MKFLVFIVIFALMFVIGSVVRAWIYGATHNGDI